MKLKLTILVAAIAAGSVLVQAQSVSAVQNTRAAMQGVNNPEPAKNASDGSAANNPATPPAAPLKSVAHQKHAAQPFAPSNDVPKRTPVIVGRAGGIVAVPKTGNNMPPAGDRDNTSRDQATGREEGKYNATGKRDPFLSPVVSHATGSGCSTGKKCLEIAAINLRGVVHSEGGFIAVVSNSLNKAYFLKENDPVFDGFVVKITGDSIIFQETLQDRLGKTFTREVVKKITTPAV